MITCTVRITTKPTEHDRFVAAALELRAATIVEDGNISYTLWAPLDRTNEVLVLEEWRDQGALDAHHRSEHMATFRRAVKGAVAAAPTSTRVEDADQE